MKISGYEQMSVFLFRNPVGQEAGRMRGKGHGAGETPEDRDTVSIALLGNGGNGRIKALFEQRQALLDRKNELINFTFEEGGGWESIQDRLDSYEEQMDELDRQIAEETARQSRELFEKPEPSKRDRGPKTEQEVEEERLSGLVELSSGFSQARTIRSSQNKLQGEDRVLECEIKMDRGRMGDGEMIAKKEERLAQLQQREAKLASAAGTLTGEMAERIQEDNGQGLGEMAEKIQEDNGRGHREKAQGETEEEKRKETDDREGDRAMV